MTLGSLFDGSGGFPLAGIMNGITPLWASEIEPFPIRVTTKRIPFMKHYGDVSQINGADIEPVDIITFGSPCQDLSVAGGREGLDGERSGLFRQAIRIIKEMREKTNGMYPTFAVWENVPGALSSGRERGEDFRIVLESFAKIIDSNADVPRPEKWSNAGCILGDGYSVAWRILDAQYWGVPQRRRRIFLVADFAGERAGRILFKPESVSRDSEQSQTAWQGFAHDTGNGTCSADKAVYDARVNGDGKTVNTLTGDHENRITDYTSVVCGLSYKAGAKSCSTAFEYETAPTLAANRADAAVVCEVPYTMKIRCGCEGGGKGALIQKDKSATIATNNDQILFEPVVALEGNGARPSHQGCGYSENDVSFTLNTTERHAVEYFAQQCVGQHSQKDKVNTLSARMEHSVTDLIVECNAFHNDVVYGIGNRQADQIGLHDAVGSLNCMHDQQAVIQRTCYSQDAYNKYTQNETSKTLMALGGSYGGGSETLIVEPHYIVRRLTPTECARLQGFPDWWCSDLGTENLKEDEIAFWSEVLETENPTEENLPFWRDVFDTYARINGTKPRSDKQILKWLKNPHTDGAEYKMWGNGVALPCVLYVLSGLVEGVES